jgi:hypothetical protein
MEQFNLKNYIPEEHWPAIEKALKSTFNFASIDNIIPVPGNFIASLVYIIVIGEKHYLLKIIKHINPMNDPARHFTCMNIAAQAGIAPKVYYSNVEDALSICDFIEKKPLPAKLKSAEGLTGLVKIIKTIQATPLFPKYLNFLELTDKLIQEFRDSQVLPESFTEEHFSFYSQIRDVYPDGDKDLVSSHNDLNVNNMLFDGKKLWIIDWDGAYQNDRYVDPAIVANNFVNSREMEEVFLREYFADQLNDYNRARFYLMQQICNIYYAMAVMKIAVYSKKEDYSGNLQQRDFFTKTVQGQVPQTPYDWLISNGKFFLQRALLNMKTKRFSAALNRLKQ